VQLSVITDEIDDDLDRALAVCAELGIHTVELRSVGGRNVAELSPQDLVSTRHKLDRGGFRVCAVASPFLKCHRGERGAAGGALHAAAPHERHEQRAVLAHSLGAARVFFAPVVRAFSYWREETPVAAAAELGRELGAAAVEVSAVGQVLALENEHECNVGSGEELVDVLAHATRELGVIWDPGNAAMLDPAGFDGLGGFDAVRDRVVHVHLKDVSPEGEWTRIGDGVVDHAALLRALDDAGYTGAVSIETHYLRDGSAEVATRECVESVRAIAASAGVELWS
jgi:sugar phosphate isomerase/epimerase